MEVLKPSEALSVLLATESFLLAAVALALAIQAPQRGFVSRFRVPKWAIPTVGIVVSVAVAVGALTAWGEMYWGGALRPTSQALVGAALVVAAVGQPLLTVVLCVGMIED